MTPDTAIVVRSPAELVEATPFVIGFHPTDSLVVLGLSAGRVFFGARHDLPPPDGDAITHLGAIVSSQRARSVALLAYGPATAVDPVIEQALLVFRAFRIRVVEAIRVDEGRWWSYYCQEATCCPAEGTPFDIATSLIAAEAVFRGHVALPNRQALVAQLAPVEGAERAAMTAATGEAYAQFAKLLVEDRADGRAVRRAGRLAVREAEKKHRARQQLSDFEVAWLGVLLIDRDVHNYALARLDDQQWRLTLWTDVLRRLEPPYVPVVASILGYLAWRLGEGALARVAVDRALRADPGHPLCALLDEVLNLGIGPHALNALGPAARTNRFAAPPELSATQPLPPLGITRAALSADSGITGSAPSAESGPPSSSGPPSAGAGHPPTRKRRLRRVLRRRSR